MLPAAIKEGEDPIGGENTCAQGHVCYFGMLRYSSIPGHGNWQIETAVWNLAGLLQCVLEPTGSDLGSFLMIYEEILSWISEIGFQKNRVGNPT